MSVNWEEIINAGVKQVDRDLADSCEGFSEWTRSFWANDCLEESVDYYLAQGIALHQQQKYQQAIRLFTKTIALDPASPEAYYYRGTSHSNLGKYKQSIKDYTQAIELKADFVKAYLHRGSCYRGLGDLASAIADFDRVVELNPEEASIYHYRGAVYSYLGSFSEAIADFTKLIELNPSASNYYNRGVIYYQTGEYENAIADLTKTVELEPKFKAAYLNLSNAYFAIENEEQARNNYSLALAISEALDPQDEHGYYAWGVAATNQSEPAIEYFNQAALISSQFNNFTLSLKIAAAIAELNDYD